MRCSCRKHNLECSLGQCRGSGCTNAPQPDNDDDEDDEDDSES